MTYLILQMLVALSLAVLMGGAIGWLIHRASHTARIQALRQGLSRQQSQLSQAQSEVAMLSDDYDEMHRRTQEELEALRQENQQIPFLNTNLEKSQLLVRQMMQRHESKVRDVTSENQALAARLKTIDDRDQAYNTVQAELDSRRRDKNRQADLQADRDDPDTKSESLPDNANTVAAAKDPQSSPAAGTNPVGNSATPSTTANIQAAASTLQGNPLQGSSIQGNAIHGSNGKDGRSWASTPLAIDIDADADPFDNVMEVGDELQRELDSAVNDDTTLDNSEADRNAVDSTLKNAPVDSASTYNTLDQTDMPAGQINLSSSETGASDTDLMNSGQLDFKLSGSRASLHADPLRNDPLLDDPMLDGSSDASSLFDPVEQRDDLQQIFGIGPVTEKALNDIGITSYTQLADLKHHEIQSIADTLQIVPGRIERDDWMGNARRQLEDVLEQL